MSGQGIGVGVRWEGQKLDPGKAVREEKQKDGGTGRVSRLRQKSERTGTQVAE